MGGWQQHNLAPLTRRHQVMAYKSCAARAAQHLARTHGSNGRLPCRQQRNARICAPPPRARPLHSRRRITWTDSLYLLRALSCAARNLHKDIFLSDAAARRRSALRTRCAYTLAAPPALLCLAHSCCFLNALALISPYTLDIAPPPRLAPPWKVIRASEDDARRALLATSLYICLHCIPLHRLPPFRCMRRAYGRTDTPAT